MTNCHVQTLWPALMRRRIAMVLQRERIELPDGDFVDLDWNDTATPTGGGDCDTPIVVIIHGLEGSSQSGYARGLMRELCDQNMRAAVFHFRGCSGEPNRLPRSYHSGETADMGFVFTRLRERFPRAPLAAVGYSLGANALLKYLGEQGDRAMPHVAVAVSTPFDLHAACQHINRGLSRVYQAHLVRSLRQTTRARLADVRKVLDITESDIHALRSFIDFDDRITAPLHGFDGAVDYYTRCSSRPFLKTIARPTLLIQAADDPFMPPSVIPHHDELSTCTALEVSAHGGHVGFVTSAAAFHGSKRKPFSPVYWLEKRIPTFLAEQFARR